MIQEILTKIETVNKERFSDLNGRNIISVTKLQDYVTTPFDKEKQAKSCEEKGQKDPNYKYAGKTAAVCGTLGAAIAGGGYVHHKRLVKKAKEEKEKRKNDSLKG